jgi:hypothetical protein
MALGAMLVLLTSTLLLPCLCAPAVPAHADDDPHSCCAPRAGLRAVDHACCSGDEQDDAGTWTPATPLTVPAPAVAPFVAGDLALRLVPVPAASMARALKASPPLRI